MKPWIAIQVTDERDVTSMNRMVQVEKGWTDANTRSQLPQPNLYARTNTIYTSTQRQAIYEKLNSIQFEKIAFPNLALSEVVRVLTEQTQRRDIDQLGINFLLNHEKPTARRRRRSTLRRVSRLWRPLPTQMKWT
jgi:hypothetical protein